MFRSTLAKLAPPILLVALAFVPNFALRQILFGILGLPFAYTIGLPFPYTDKPFFVSPGGAIAISIFWAAIYGIIAARRGRAKV